MDMRVKDFDDFRRPSRKPWLLLLIVLLLGGWLLQRFGCRREEAESEREKGVSPITEEVGHGSEATDATVPGESHLTPDGALASPESAADVRELYEQAQAVEARDDWVEARRLYLTVLDRARDPKMIRDAEERLGRIGIGLLTTPRPMPEKEDYVVKRGDAIERIARAFGTTIDLVEVGNNIQNRNLIREGDRLRVFTGKFALTVSKRRRELIVRMNGEFFQRYPVGIGRHDQTPEGTFVVAEKQKEPVWWPQGREIPFGHPDNILGTRWMSLRATGSTPDVRGYGIHGTWEPESIGKAESAGCIRMVNRDVEELYIYIPVNTPVTIMP
jgi:lipoprotein-anchoring transpeptidase ErfK/SrfK